jgi:CRISPR-associated endonuclease/helicase Cas3
MTATMSRAMRSELAAILGADVITVEGRDVEQIQSQAGTVKTLHVGGEPLTGEAAAQNLGERTLVICNRVDRAQAVYDELCEVLSGRDDPPKHLLLHSRFLPSDRAEKEEKVRSWLKKGSTEHAVVVATQVVEAGLDVSADVQHLEVSPVDSFLQRVGRSARFSQTHADVYVYPVDGALPYDQVQTEATLDALRRHASKEGALRYEHLQSLIDAVLTDPQNAILQSYEAGEGELQRTIDAARRDVDYGRYPELIRHVDAVDVVVAEPEAVRAAGNSAFAYDAVSVPRSTFQGFLRANGTQAWVAGTRDVRGDEETGEILQDAAGLPLKEWPSRRFVVPPAHAAYTSRRGLRLGEEGTVTFAPSPTPSSWTRRRYEREPYALHVRRVLDRSEVRKSVVDAIERLSASAGSEVNVRDPHLVVDLMLWAHDVAKLSRGWQAACGSPETPLAHGGRVAGRRPPPHAAESAFMTGNLLGATLTGAGEDAPTVHCVINAIRTHHSPGATSLHDVEVPPDARRYLKEKTPDLLGDRASHVLGAWDRMKWACPEHESPNWPDVSRNVDVLYRLLVYALRRSDQLATSLVTTPR